MKRDLENKDGAKTKELKDQKGEITSASIENAHATGDGAVQKTDELLPTEEDQSTLDTNPY